MQIITRKGTKMGHDNTQVRQFPSKGFNYPQINYLKYILMMPQELAKEEDNQDYKNKTLNELLQLLTKEEAVA